MLKSSGFLLLLLLTGCASTSARSILREKDTGIVAIPENTDAFPDYHRSQAMRMIRDHVGPDYEIVREEEYVLGPVVTNETNFVRKPSLGWLIPWRWTDEATSTITNKTHNQTEYRLQYQKRTDAARIPSAIEFDLPPLSDGIGRP